VSADSTAPVPGASADSATAETAASTTDLLNASLAKLQIPPEAAEQLVPVVTEYVTQVGGPKTASLLKDVF
jgi:hypothetical protein